MSFRHQESLEDLHGSSFSMVFFTVIQFRTKCWHLMQVASLEMSWTFPSSLLDTYGCRGVGYGMRSSQCCYIWLVKTAPKMACSIPSPSHLSLTTHCVGSLNTKLKSQATYVGAGGSDTRFGKAQVYLQTQSLLYGCIKSLSMQQVMGYFLPSAYCFLCLF